MRKLIFLSFILFLLFTACETENGSEPILVTEVSSTLAKGDPCAGERGGGGCCNETAPSNYNDPSWWTYKTSTWSEEMCKTGIQCASMWVKRVTSGKLGFKSADIPFNFQVTGDENSRSLSWVGHWCDETKIYRDGTWIATLPGPYTDSYTDNTTLTAGTYDYKIEPLASGNDAEIGNEGEESITIGPEPIEFSISGTHLVHLPQDENDPPISKTWSANVTSGSASSYQWKYNGVVVGTGSSYTRQYTYVWKPIHITHTLELTIDGVTVTKTITVENIT